MRGFTLIETLVYLALYAILIGGSLACVYSMFESGARNETAAMVEEEGDYLTAKIDWSLSGAASVQSPGVAGNTLSLARSDGTSISIGSFHSDMSIKDGASAWQALNNADVSVSNLIFTHTTSASDGLDPESIAASFTLHATTSDGQQLSRDFSTLEYLRK